MWNLLEIFIALLSLGVISFFSSLVIWYFNQSRGVLKSSSDCDLRLRRNCASLCNGLSQSPININRGTTVSVEKSKRLTWTGYEEIPSCMFIENTGLSVEMRTTYEYGAPILQWNDRGQSTFYFDYLTFRWPSEHTIDHKKFPLEMQAFHVFCPRDADATATQTLLVISYLFEESAHDNPYLDALILHIDAICRSAGGPPIEIPPFPLSWLCTPLLQGFYQYCGSQNKPPYCENVTWLLSLEKGLIGRNQINELLRLRNTCRVKILGNARPVQLLNTRIVYLNKHVA